MSRECVVNGMQAISQGGLTLQTCLVDSCQYLVSAAMLSPLAKGCAARATNA
jgi:hypothetical protein